MTQNLVGGLGKQHGTYSERTGFTGCSVSSFMAAPPLGSHHPT